MSEMEWIVLWLASGLVLALLMAFTDWWNGEDVTLSGVGMMVVLIAGIGFAAYVAIRAFGARHGLLVTALLGHHITGGMSYVPLALQQKARLRMLAVALEKRHPFFPDVPTFKELGFDVEYYLWVGIFAPKATPAPIVATLSSAIEKAANSDVFKTALTNAGQELAYLNGPDFQKFWDADGKKTDEAVVYIGKQ